MVRKWCHRFSKLVLLSQNMKEFQVQIVRSAIFHVFGMNGIFRAIKRAQRIISIYEKPDVAI